MDKKKTNKINKQIPKIAQKFRQHVTTALVAAFGFVIALSWNDAIKDWVNRLIENLHLPSTFYKFSAAIAITLICVLGIIIVSRWGSKEKQVKQT